MHVKSDTRALFYQCIRVRRVEYTRDIWHEMTVDTYQMRGISIPDECASAHKKCIQVYIRLTRLVGESTTCKSGAKPQ